MAQRIELDLKPTMYNKHLISVGDRVIACVTGAGCGDIRVGVYAGRYPSGSAAVDVNSEKQMLIHKTTREAYDHVLESKELPYPSSYVNGRYQPDAAAWDTWRKAKEARQADYEYETQPHTWRTILQNNNIWLLDTIAASGRL